MTATWRSTSATPAVTTRRAHLDPRSKIPEYKVSACRLRRADAPPDWLGTEVAAETPTQTARERFPRVEAT